MQNSTYCNKICDNSYYYTLYIFLLYKSRKIIWMFYEKFADEGINAMDNLNIYNVEGYNMLSPGIQPLTTESVFKIRFFTVQLCNCIFYTRKYFAVYKTNSQILNIFEQFCYNKTNNNILSANWTLSLRCVPLKKSGPLN